MEENNAEIGDAVLIREYLDGNPASFEILYNRYRRRLYALIYSYRIRHSLVDEIFQQTWIRVIEKFPESYKHSEHFFSWLAVIARNLIVDNYRKEKRAGALTAEDFLLYRNDVEGAPEPWQEMGNGEFMDAFEKSVAELPGQLREVVNLRRNGVSFKDIAEIQKCPINTALGRMNLAMKHLRKSLCEWRSHE